jgi:hypothetical protein
MLPLGPGGYECEGVTLPTPSEVCTGTALMGTSRPRAPGGLRARCGIPVDLSGSPSRGIVGLVMTGEE